MQQQHSNNGRRPTTADGGGGCRCRDSAAPAAGGGAAAAWQTRHLAPRNELPPFPGHDSYALLFLVQGRGLAPQLPNRPVHKRGNL